MSGASGHLMHLYDNRDLTFGELKDIITSAAEGRLEKISEKLDGMNLVFTWDGGLRVARSGGDIARGGMDAAALAAKFYDRENVADAFNGAFKVLEDSIAALPDDAVEAIFLGGSTWYSIEVVYPKSANVINYDGNYVVFHASPVFEVTNDGKVERRTDDPEGLAVLTKYVEQMQNALTQRNWRVKGPSLLRLQKISDGSVLNAAIDAIEREQNAAGVNDDNTLGDLLRARVSEAVADLGLSQRAHNAVVLRIVGDPGAPGLPEIKKMVPAHSYPIVNKFIKDADRNMLKTIIEPIEHAIHRFAVELLRGVHSTLVGNPSAEVGRLQGRVAQAIKNIESSGDEKAMDVLSSQMKKLGSSDDITSAIEGVVFIYRGNAYKFTAQFAPVNRILGLFRYNR